jgi:hypothetical protein
MARLILSFLRLLGACVLIAMGAAAMAAPCDTPRIDSEPKLPSVTRGQSVTVFGDCFSGHSVNAFLNTGKVGGIKGPFVAKATDDGKALNFEIQNDVQPGRYLITLDFGSPPLLAVPGELRVLSAEQAKVKIDSISPSTAYPTNGNNTYNFKISGENLSLNPNDNIVEDVDRGPLLSGSQKDCNASPQTYEKMCLSYDNGMEGRKLSVTGFNAGSHQGSVGIRVRVGDDNVSETKTIKLSSLPEGAVRALAILVSAIFGLIVLGMVRKGMRLSEVGASGGMLDWFFMDKQTNSYSLSKFQLVAWTTIAVFGYVYVLFSRTLIQNDFSFPAVPSGWPTLLGLSAATTVAAVGLTSTRGSKGAGPDKPSLADFISAGGMVTGDRFQFFVWTLVGFLGFLMLVLLADPSSLKALPDIPDGFLYLTGVSAAGYLGGKAVRPPGPVIHEVLAKGAPLQGSVNLTILLKGENLATNASIKIDGIKLRPDEFVIEEAKSSPSSLSTEINITLLSAAKYIQGQYDLTLINGDGQMAVVKFPVDPLKLDAVVAVEHGTAAIPVKVTGQNFGDNMTAEWTAPGQAAPTIILANDVKKIRVTEADVTLIPGAAGNGTLTLISANNLRASSPVKVT